jgi:hypothetical protein
MTAALVITIHNDAARSAAAAPGERGGRLSVSTVSDPSARPRATIDEQLSGYSDVTARAVAAL